MLLRWPFNLFILPLSSIFAEASLDHKHDTDESLFHFVSRPDLKAPRWNIKTLDKDSITPGYWFVAPFASLNQKRAANGWVGPHIYDNNGELIWSGVEVSAGWDAIDFRVSDVRGEDRLTFLVQKTGEAFILDSNYEVQEKLHVEKEGGNFNSHEFHFISDGRKAIVMDENHMRASSEMAVAANVTESCLAQFDGFRVLDTVTWKPVFEWNSYDHVGLEESTFLDGGVETLCSNPWPWDFIHTNAVDEDADGNYYLSARHTDTIYKISGVDGHIIWRLNGRNSPHNSFTMLQWEGRPLSFSRQHNVRYRGHNGTHDFISILDNAKGQDNQKGTHKNSRGLVMALNTAEEVMTAGIISSIEHPDGAGSYAPRRGNYQVLGEQRVGRDNVWMCWSEQATVSEHLPDGTLVMEATLQADFLGSYRSYKFPWKGTPKEPPAVHSAAYASEARNSTTTLVHVSQNGATEIASWRLYKTTPEGSPRLPIFEEEWRGFETSMAWDGYAAYVVVEAVDKAGSVVATSDIVKTIEPGADDQSAAVADELYWLQEQRGDDQAWSKKVYAAASTKKVSRRSFFIFVMGSFFGAALLACARRVRMRGRERQAQYHALSIGEEGLYVENSPKWEADFNR